MYEQQGESDEDCEVYFLKPVNEYNIVDKIKEANKELFSEPNDDETKIIEDLELSESTTSVCTTITTIATSTITTTTTTRKVTFAPNLEDYEPENSTQSEEQDAETNDVRHKTKSGIDKFPTIDEQEEQINGTQQPAENSEHENLESTEEVIFDETTEASEQNNKSNDKTAKDHTEQDDIDEICEEIIIMEMDGSITTTTTTSATTTISTTALLKEDSLNAQQRRLMQKQTTFDYDEQDNKSLTNLLTASDCEEEHGYSAMRDTDDSDANDASIFVGIDDFDDEDEDDDDKLSLIVASYLPDDFERKVAMTPSPSPSLATASASSNTTKSNTSTKSNNSYSYFRRGSGKSSNSAKKINSPSSSTFGRRFQLRRKAHSTNSIGAMCGADDNVGSHINNVNDGCKAELTDLKLNYKTCCEYRNSIQGKLPKYTGYLSEYGLSREQLQQREQQLQKKQRFVLEQTLRANEDEIRKMQDNERAFTTWLKNKMRFPINKTRNMFDVKLSLNGRRKTKTTTNSATATNAKTSAVSNNKTNRSPFGCAAKLTAN